VISYGSPSAERILGDEPEQVIGEQSFERVHPADRGRIVEPFERVVGAPGGVVDGNDYRCRAADDSRVRLESTTTGRTIPRPMAT
jgi:PAS domain-containing protein